MEKAGRKLRRLFTIFGWFLGPFGRQFGSILGAKGVRKAFGKHIFFKVCSRPPFGFKIEPRRVCSCVRRGVFLQSQASVFVHGDPSGALEGAYADFLQFLVGHLFHFGGFLVYFGSQKASGRHSENMYYYIYLYRTRGKPWEDTNVTKRMHLGERERETEGKRKACASANSAAYLVIPEHEAELPNVTPATQSRCC